MAEQLAPLTARTVTVAELVKLAGSGKIRVPSFQRGLRWESRDVRRLFDSILNGYPIGSLLLWERPAEQARLLLGAVQIDAPADSSALWVVDGQQRITSIVNAVSEVGSKDSRFALVYDLQDGQIRSPRPGRGGQEIPLPIVFDLRGLLAWFRDRPELGDLVESANDVTTRIRQYPVNLSIVSDASEDVLRDIFDRTNNYGRRLTRAEIFAALNPPSAGKGLTYGEIAERIDAQTGFGVIDDDTVLRIILSRRGADVTREIRAEFSTDASRRSEFPDESPDQAHTRAEIAAVTAIRFLQNQANVPHFSLLTYRYLLIVLARFFAHFPEPSPRNLVLLRRWFWRAAVLGPEIFKGSASGAIRALNNRITPANEAGSIEQLLDAARRPPFQPVDVEVFRTSNASTRLVLAAMWAHRPRSLVTGEEFSVDALTLALGGASTANAVAGDIVPRRRLNQQLRAAAGNRYWALDIDSDGLLDFATVPTLTVSDTDRDLVLRSHVVDDCLVDHLDHGRFDEFVKTRGEAIHTLTSEFLLRMREPDHEDTPPLSGLVLDDDIQSESREPERDDA